LDDLHQTPSGLLLHWAPSSISDCFTSLSNWSVEQ
jgi:hypothetical protein